MTISESHARPARADAGAAAFAEPTAKVTGRWISLWSLANFMVTGLVFGASSILGPQLAQAIDPENKVGTMAVAGILAGIIPVVGGPLFGALSDRTTARRGRRHPWILLGAFGTAAVFAVQAVQTTVAGYLITSILLGCFIAILTTSIVAVIPDDVPVGQRATVSAWGGAVGGSVGLLFGTALVAVAVTGLTAGYTTMAVLLVVGVVPFAVFTRGAALDRADRPSWRWGAFFRTLWVSPRRHPDFWWAIGGRFLFFLANGLFSTYLFFFLQDSVHYPDPAVGVLILTTVYVVFAALSSVPVGRLSDRLRKRKNITIVSAAAQAAACVVLAVSQTWTAAIVGAVLLGVGFGVYSAVDQALVTEVLPTAAGRGKDMGLITMTSTLATLLTPAIAAPVILHLGGYAGLFLLAAVVGVLSAVLVRPIKSVR
ncbi:MFS transporter [Amycolatopsis sp. NPDC098790]|uniref:MFS transporter n=1 Tax=Amycolatopsis sp. NPDC098790 TaxID=3363939 RepID=UPI00382ED7E2